MPSPISGAGSRGGACAVPPPRAESSTPGCKSAPMATTPGGQGLSRCRTLCRSFGYLTCRDTPLPSIHPLAVHPSHRPGPRPGLVHRPGPRPSSPLRPSTFTESAGGAGVGATTRPIRAAASSTCWRTWKALPGPRLWKWLRHRGLLDGTRTAQGRVPRRSRGRDGGISTPALENRSTGRTAQGQTRDSAPGRGIRRDWAVRVWKRAAPIPVSTDHPARRWLARRHLWRPGPTPAAVRAAGWTPSAPPDMAGRSPRRAAFTRVRGHGQGMIWT